MSHHEHSDWPDDLSPKERLEAAQAVIDELQSEVTRAIATREIYLEAAYNEDVPAAFDNSLEARGFNLIVDALHSDLVLILMRIYDGPTEIHKWVVARDLLA